MNAFQYCLCPAPILIRNGQKQYCRHCWNQPIPPYTEHTMPLDVLEAWVRESIKRGMGIERIGRDLVVGRVNIMQILERGSHESKRG